MYGRHAPAGPALQFPTSSSIRHLDQKGIAMHRSARPRWASLLVAGALALPLTLALAGCTGDDAETDTSGGASGAATAVAVPDLVTGVEGAFEGQEVTLDEGSLTCPGALPASAGAEQRCRFTADGQPVEAVVTVTAVDGDDVTFDVTTAALPVPAAGLQTVVAEQLTALGASVDGVTCDRDLAPTDRATATCQVTGGGETYGVTVTASGTTGGIVGYEITAS